MTFDRLIETNPTNRHARLFVRSEPLSVGRRDAVAERLETLTREDRLGSHAVDVWGSRVDLRGGGELPRTFDRFQNWAERADVELEPGFGVREGTTLVEEPYEQLVTPAVALAIYDGETLLGVFPHVDGDRLVTVDAALSALAGEDDGDDLPFVSTGATA
jgi:hypothetical protein